MIKIYKLNRGMNSARIILKGKSGNEVVYKFNNGNVITNTPARLSLSSEYDQMLLEGSDMFKSGVIQLERVVKTDDDIKREAENKARYDALDKVDDVKSVTEAIAYCVEHFNEKATNARNALEIAEKNGVTFPNLKLGKK